MKKYIVLCMTVILFSLLLVGCKGREEQTTSEEQKGVQKENKESGILRQDFLNKAKEYKIVNAADNEQTQSAGNDMLYYIESEEGGSIFTLSYQANQSTDVINKIQLAINVEKEAQEPEHFISSMKSLIKIVDDEATENMVEEIIKEIQVAAEKSEGSTVQNGVQYTQTKAGDIRTFTITFKEKAQ